MAAAAEQPEDEEIKAEEQAINDEVVEEPVKDTPASTSSKKSAKETPTIAKAESETTPVEAAPI